MKKIGIYIAKAVNCNRIYKEHNLPFGLRAIIQEIDTKQYKVNFCNIKNVNDFDYVLFSVNSHYDYLILIRDFYQKNIKPQIICGGSDLINLHLLKNVIDVAVVGRAEGQINEILAGVQFANVWRKENDYQFKLKYIVRQPQYLLTVGNKTEVNVGCDLKCKFCQYGAKFAKFKKTKGYSSGNNDQEVMFRQIDWNKAKSRVISSIDATTEQARIFVGKPIPDSVVIQKFRDAYNHQNKKTMRLILYCIIGYPWDCHIDARLTVIQRLLFAADKRAKTHDLLIDFRFNHFIPMLLTPFETFPVNSLNFRQILRDNFSGRLYTGVNIKSSIYTSIVHSSTAMDRVYVYRSFYVDKHILELSNYKYYAKSHSQKADFYRKHPIVERVEQLPSFIYS